MSFLDQLAQTLPRMAKSGELMAMPPSPRGGISGGSHPVLARLRRQQLVDLARAFGIQINRDAPKWQILPILEAADMQGAFNGPPKNPFHAERAKYSSDVVKDLKANYHPSQWPKCLNGTWDGPDPNCDLEPKYEKEPPPHGGKYTKNVSEWSRLAKEAKALGINTKWMKVEEMKREIAVKRGEMDAGATQTAA